MTARHDPAAALREADEWVQRANELQQLHREIVLRERALASMHAARAEGIARLLTDGGYSRREVSRLLGRSPTWVGAQSKIAKVTE